MSSQLIVALAIAVLFIFIGLFIAIIVFKRKRKGVPVKTDYYAFFVLGVSFLLLGIVLGMAVTPGFIGITGLGIVYMIIGLSNRDEWRKKNEKNQ